MSGWTQTESALPPEGALVDAITPNGSPRVLRRKGNLWFLPDMSMYVYFTPVWWREISETP